MNDHPLPEIDPDESTIEDFELTATDLEAAGPPHPVNWNLLSADDLEAEWLELNRWVDWLRKTYGLPASVIPPFWHHHPELVWELSALGSAEGSVDFLTALRSREDSDHAEDLLGGVQGQRVGAVGQRDDAEGGLCRSGSLEVSAAGLGPLSAVGRARLRASG